MVRRFTLEKERRNHVRQTFELHSEGTLSLTVNGNTMPVLDMQDISVSGIGLLIDGHVNNGIEVGLQFIHGTTNIEVIGTVIWNSITDSESHKSLVGIHFHEQDMPLIRYFQRHKQI